MTSPEQPVGFLRLPDVLRLVPVSRSSWWAGCKSGRYPAPVKLGPNTTAWRASDIQTLISQLSGSSATSRRGER